MNIAAKAALGLVFVVSSILLARPVRADESMKPTLEVNDLRVVVKLVSTLELVNLQRQFGAHIDLRDIRHDHRRAFSILKTHRETGARTCEIYLPAEHQPRRVDDEGTLSLGHELLHCMRGSYHR